MGMAMDKKFSRIYLVEALGAFALVYFAAGAVLVNYLSTGGQDPATLPLNGHQPGVVGVALAQGLILAVMLILTAPLTGGYLNPAISIMLWVFNRLDTARMCWLVGAQLLAGERLDDVEAERRGLIHRLVKGEAIKRPGLAAEAPAELLGVWRTLARLLGPQRGPVQAQHAGADGQRTRGLYKGPAVHDLPPGLVVRVPLSE